MVWAVGKTVNNDFLKCRAAAHKRFSFAVVIILLLFGNCESNGGQYFAEATHRSNY